MEGDSPRRTETDGRAERQDEAEEKTRRGEGGSLTVGAQSMDSEQRNSLDEEDTLGNYNTIASLTALKDILQAHGRDAPEADQFFQHYFLNHCNNLTRRLSRCREEDEGDPSHHSTVVGSKHTFHVTKLPGAPPPEPPPSAPHNAHTVHFGTRGAEATKPRVQNIFASGRLHRDRTYFDSSLIEIRSPDSRGAQNIENVWIKRDGHDNVGEKGRRHTQSGARSSGGAEASRDFRWRTNKVAHADGGVRPRSGSWDAPSTAPTKTTTPAEKKALKCDTPNGPKHAISTDSDAAITRSNPTVSRPSRGFVDDSEQQNTVYGTTRVSKRPAIFRFFDHSSGGNFRFKKNVYHIGSSKADKRTNAEERLLPANVQPEKKGGDRKIRRGEFQKAAKCLKIVTSITAFVAADAKMGNKKQKRNTALSSKQIRQRRIAAAESKARRLQGILREHSSAPLPSTDTANGAVENESGSYLVDNTEPTEPKSFYVDGRRIVDFMFLFTQLQFISHHDSPLQCNLSYVEVLDETQNGFCSKFTFKCRNCSKIMTALSNKENPGQMDLNESLVSGIMSVGLGHTALSELFSVAGINCMSQKLYAKCHKKVCEWWEKAKIVCMIQTAKEEARLATENGEVDENGTPLITVVADACWSKRSYGKLYNALSGAAAFIGYRTKQILYMVVKNKYCSICARAEHKEEDPPEHQCFKNYVGSSSGMESAAILEGFKTSKSMHGLIYSKLIADGDASTYKKIRELNSTSIDHLKAGMASCSARLFWRCLCKLHGH